MFYILLNALLITTVIVFDKGYIYVSFFVFGGHVRDTLAIFIHIVSMIWRFLKRNICNGNFASVKPVISSKQQNIIYSLIPVYNEDIDMVTKNLDSLVSQKLPENTVNTLILIFDGVNEKNKGLFEEVNKLVEYDEERAGDFSVEYSSWKNSQKSKLSHSEGYYKGLRIVVAHKSVNRGKKDSLIVGERLIAHMYADDHGVFVYHTDGDTVADENCIGELLSTMLKNESVDAVSSLVRVYKRDNLTFKESAFSLMQDFQYFYSLMIRRNAESDFSSTTCLPGCSNLVRINHKSADAIVKYESIPSNREGLLQVITRYQGTDRRYTTLLMREGGNLKMNHKAVVFTEPPLDSSAFIRQRRRWSSNSFFNSIVMLYSSGMSTYVKFSAFIDVTRMFTAIFRLFSYILFWLYLDEFSTLNLVLGGVFLVFPYLYCFIWAMFIIPKWYKMVLGFLMNKLIMPWLSVVSISKMFMTATNFDWGLKPSSVSDKPIEEEKEIVKIDGEDVEYDMENPVFVSRSRTVSVTSDPFVSERKVKNDSFADKVGDIQNVSDIESKVDD